MQRSFATLWGVAQDYRVVDGHVCPVVDGELVRPGGGVGHGLYPPMARPELPRELARAATGDEADVLEFVGRYGLLGYTEAWRFEELAGLITLYRGGEQAKQAKAPGDPLAWLVAHARTVKLVLVDLADYTFNSTHNFLDDVPAGARVSTSDALTGKAVTNGAFTSANSKFPLASGDESEALFLYIDTGTDATSALIAFIDNATGLPISPDGTDITINLSSGIFSL